MMNKTRGVWDAEDCALILIDYQPEMFINLRSASLKEIEHNISTIARAAVALKMPIVLSTLAVGMGLNKSTILSLKNELPGITEIDRTNINAWEDSIFLEALKQTGKRRLVFCALPTDTSLAFSVAEALKDSYDVAIVVDAVGGMSKNEHEIALARLIQAGAIPNTTHALISGWFRDLNSPRSQIGKDILIGYLYKKANLEHASEGFDFHMVDKIREDSITIN